MSLARVLQKSQVTKEAGRSGSPDFPVYDMNKLLSILGCPICKKFCKDAVTINLCMDTFCKDCIHKAFQDQGKFKDCPKCKKALGTGPQRLLRPDHQKQSIIEHVIEVEKIIIESETSEANNTKPDIGESIELASKPQPPNVDTSNEIGEKCQEDSGDSGMKLKELKKKKKKNNKQRMKERARQQGSGQEKGKEKVEPSNVQKEISKGKSKVEGHDEEQFSYMEQPKARSFWINLVPKKDEAGHAYPALKSPYIRLKDAHMTMSIMRKYLKQKLNLKDESEIDVMCCGEILDGGLTLSNIEEMWLKSTVSDYDKKKAKWEVKELMIELGYIKSKNVEVPKKK